MGFVKFLGCASVCAILFDLLTQKQLRLTPTLSNCDALLSMLANASLGGFSSGWIDNTS
ncbi:hypothetical protein JT143_07415 [Helicobacter pylori]|nr:hypothetical protein [Helicobacter pylori]